MTDLRWPTLVALPALLVGVMSCTNEEPPAPTAQACEYPEFRPTYLPWLEPGEEVSAGTELLSSKSIVWGPGESRNPDQVKLQTKRKSRLDHYRGSRFQRLMVRGEEAYLVWVGDPGVGELTIHWDEGDGPCESYVLHYRDQDSFKHQVEAEIIKIAESLE
ncbi:MAG: hypothetical protein ACRDKT_15770 [Actinomycetota bacterium]